MPDETKHLRRLIDLKLDRMINDMQVMKARLTSLRDYTQAVGVSRSLDCIERDIAQIKKRLDLVDT
jgi:hypothetical protein